MSVIVKSVDLSFPVEMVWEALTTSEDLAKWLMPNDFRAVEGHRFTFQADPAPGFDGIVQSEVLRIDPQSALHISWVGGGLETTVLFTLTRKDTGCRLDVRHEGFAAKQFPIKMFLGLGWRRILRKKLPGHLSGSAGSAQGVPCA